MSRADINEFLDNYEENMVDAKVDEEIKQEREDTKKEADLLFIEGVIDNIIDPVLTQCEVVLKQRGYYAKIEGAGRTDMRLTVRTLKKNVNVDDNCGVLVFGGIAGLSYTVNKFIRTIKIMRHDRPVRNIVSALPEVTTEMVEESVMFFLKTLFQYPLEKDAINIRGGRHGGRRS